MVEYKEPVGPHAGVWATVIHEVQNFPEACLEVLEEAILDFYDNVSAKGRNELVFLFIIAFNLFACIVVAVFAASQFCMILSILNEIILFRCIDRVETALGWCNAVVALKEKEWPYE